jgi:hypothetical protein
VRTVAVTSEPTAVAFHPKLDGALLLASRGTLTLVAPDGGAPQSYALDPSSGASRQLLVHRDGTMLFDLRERQLCRVVFERSQ